MSSPQVSFVSDVARQFPDCLRDESRRTGRAEGIAFPATVAEVCDLMRLAATQGRTVTFQGARTGIAAGAVPEGGYVLSLARLDRILGLREAADGTPCVRVQPGLTLDALRAFLDGAGTDTTAWSAESLAARSRLKAGRWTFTPDPTETSASLGGMVACNASGARSFAHGATRGHVTALLVALADGDLLDLARGGARATGRRFSLKTRGGRTLAGELPGYDLPAVKNASGYHAAPDMEMIDLFIGSEGTLGAIVEMELRLQPRPPATWGILVFLPEEDRALALVEDVRGRTGATRPVAIEYFDHGVLDLLREARTAGARLPPLPAERCCGLYLEYAAGSEDEAAARGEELARLLAARGADAAHTWAATDDGSLQRLKEFRHAAPEQVNRRIAERQQRFPALTKLGTDLAVPDSRLREVMALYRRDLAQAGLEHVVFGHVGNNHLHVNILPRDMTEYAQGKALYEGWARQVSAWGGSVSAEHGIGKLKTGLLRVMYGDEGIAEMRRLKRVFDPAGQLNAGNLFPAET